MSKISEMTRESGSRGNFQRQSNSFTTPFGDGPGELPVEAGRYRLIAGAICPWAHRQVIVRELLGLTDAISVGVVDPIRGEWIRHVRCSRVQRSLCQAGHHGR